MMMIMIIVLEGVFYLACLCYKSGEVPARRKTFSLTALGVRLLGVSLIL